MPYRSSRCTISTYILGPSYKLSRGASGGFYIPVPLDFNKLYMYLFKLYVRKRRRVSRRVSARLFYYIPIYRGRLRVAALYFPPSTVVTALRARLRLVLPSLPS